VAWGCGVRGRRADERAIGSLGCAMPLIVALNCMYPEELMSITCTALPAPAEVAAVVGRGEVVQGAGSGGRHQSSPRGGKGGGGGEGCGVYGLVGGWVCGCGCG